MPPKICSWLPLIRAGIIVVGSIVMTFYLYGANTRAQWGCVDDHEVVNFLGKDHVMSICEFWPKLMETEVGKPGCYPRYRPSYYALRLIETILWGNSPLMWYVARLAAIAFAVCVSWVLLGIWLGFLSGSLVTMWIFSYRYWAGIFCRLGPAEIYAVMGFAIFMYGFVACTCDSKLKLTRAFCMWCLVCMGSVLAMGSKENFLIMLPLVWVAGVFIWWRYRLGASVIIGLALVTALALLISYSVVCALSQTGQDIYVHSVKPSSRLLSLGLGKHGLFRQTYWYMTGWQRAGCIASFMAVILVCLRQKSLPVCVIRATVVIVGLGVLYVSQFVFYDGQLPTGMRYDFPAMTVVPLFWATIGWMLLRLVAEYGGRNSVNIGRLLFNTALFLIVVSNSAMGVIREDCEKNKRATQSFTRKMMNVSEVLRSHGNVPLTVVATCGMDYENVFSIERFLRFYGVTNDFYMKVQGPKPSGEMKPLEKQLLVSLESISLNGKPGIYRPIALRPHAYYTFAVTGDASVLGYSLGALNYDY